MAEDTLSCWQVPKRVVSSVAQDLERKLWTDCETLTGYPPLTYERLESLLGVVGATDCKRQIWWVDDASFSQVPTGQKRQ